MSNGHTGTGGAATLQLQAGDDLVGSGVAQAAPAATSAPANGTSTSGLMLVDEILGKVVLDPTFPGEAGTEAAEAFAEVGIDGAESGEEYAEATAAELAAPPSGESAISDLRSIEGFEEVTAAEAAASTEAYLPEAGEASAEGGEEFFPILAGLASAVLPTLVSKAGPPLARAVLSRFTGTKLARIKRLAKLPGLGVPPMLRKLLEVSEATSESGAEAVDEALINETVHVLEVIIGRDDRVRITQTQKVPWRMICALRITARDNKTFRGSGWLLGPRTLATAGHCVYMHDHLGWVKQIEVIPGCNGAQRPFNSAIATSFRSVQGWVQGKQAPSDIGAIILPPGAFAGQQLGSFGFGSFPTATLLAQQAVLAGYPGDKPFAELWGMARKLKTVTPNQLIYEIDTMGGQSGAPVYIKYQGKRYVVGIHNYGASSGNSATRITAPVFNVLKNWSKL